MVCSMRNERQYLMYRLEDLTRIPSQNFALMRGNLTRLSQRVVLYHRDSIRRHNNSYTLLQLLLAQQRASKSTSSRTHT